MQACTPKHTSRREPHRGRRGSHAAKERMGVPSREVIRHNQDSERNLHCIEKIDQPTEEGHSVAVTGRANHTRFTQCLEGLSTAIQDLDAATNGVQNSHWAFIALRETQGVENFERWRKNCKLPPTSSRMSKVHFDTNVPAADGGHSSEDSGERKSVCARKSTEIKPLSGCKSDRGSQSLSASQKKAVSRFVEIDEGRADSNAVFADVHNNRERVMTRLDFYRDRQNLVLPQIEERFMKEDLQTGDALVDVARLRLHVEQPARTSCSSARGPRLKPLKHQVPDGSQTDRGVAKSPYAAAPPSPSYATCATPLSLAASSKGFEANEEVLHNMESTTLSHVSSKSTLAPSCSMVSLQQRAEKIAELGQLRDIHIKEVQEAKRERAQAQRLAVFDVNHKKSLRKDTANRHRTLLTWVILAMATDVMARSWSNFKSVHKELQVTLTTEERTLVRRGTSGIQRITLAEAAQCMTSQLAPRHVKKVLETLNRSWRKDIRLRCSRHAFRSWCHLFRIFRFVSILMRRIKLNHQADTIKELINSTWRGYIIRASIGRYMKQVKLLQRAMRLCVKLRIHVRNFIFLPMVWEAETTLLGGIIGMPPPAMEREMEMHRATWDPKARYAEATKLIHERLRWSSRPGQSTVRLYYEKMEPTGAPPPTKETKMRTSISSNSRKGNDEEMIAKTPSGRSRRGALQQMQHCLSATQSKNSHPMMEVIDRYRLPPKLREKVTTGLLRENTDRWLARYKEYKKTHATFVRSWQKWRLDIAALGPAHRNIWPPAPQFPIYPYELLKVDQKSLQARVLAQLKHTEAGQLL